MSARADAQGSARIDIAATRLSSAIAELSREGGVSIGTEGSLPDRRTPAVHGRMAIGEALQRLLAGSGWRARQVGARAWRIERAPMIVARPTPPAPAPHHDAPPPEVADSEPIIVTGLKRPSLLDTVPAAIAVVSLSAGDDVRGTSGTARIAAQTDGLSLTALGPGRNRMFLRGVSDSALNGESQSTVAVLLDGARITFSAPDPDIRLVDVERVELLKGPQGSLYGSGTLGGIYNIVSRQPDVDATTLSTSLSLDATASGDVRPGGTVVANLPLVRGSAALRFVGYSAASPGWVDTGDRHDSNQTRALGARAALRVDLSPAWELGISGLAQCLGTDDSQYVYRAHARSRPAQLAEPHDNDLQHVALRLSGPTPLGDLTLHSSMTMHEVGDTLDATIGAESFGLNSPQILDDERQYRVWENEARLAGRLGNASWQTGLVWLDARQSEVAVLSASVGPSLTVDDDHRRTQELALFGDMSLPLGHDVTLDAGGRLFRTTVRERRVIGATTIIRDRHKSGLTPTIALSWQPSRRQMAWVRYASAQRPGGSDIGPAGTFELLEGDELQSFEAGWRGTVAQGVRVEIGGWWSRWSHIQSDVLLANGLIETVNAGTGRMRGLEVTLTSEPATGWHVVLGGSWSDARLVHTTLGFEIDDNSLPVVPNHVARAAVSRAFTLGGSEASVGVMLRYVGPSHLSFDPAADRRMGDMIESRIDVSWRHGTWLLALSIDNVLGKSGNAFAYGNPFRFRTMPQFTPQAPTSVALTVSRQF